MKCPICGKSKPNEFKTDNEFLNHIENKHKDDLHKDHSLFEYLVKITDNPAKFSKGLQKILKPEIDKNLKEELSKYIK